jgi:hypothetical protein
MPAQKTPKALAKFKAAILHTVDLRDKRDDALKEAAAALAALEAMVESDAIGKDIDSAEDEYERKVDVFAELETALNRACGDMVAECYTAVLTSNNPEDMAKA